MRQDPHIPRRWIVAALVRLYPAGWRSEYGAELTDILLARPLGPCVIGDVALNGLQQRARAAEPSTILGLVAMLVILAGFVLAIGNYAGDAGGVLQPSSKTFPTVTVRFFTSELYALLLLACGCWTHLRHGGKVHQSGLAGMRMSLIAGTPVMIAAVLMMFGIVQLKFMGTHLPSPSPLAVLVTPLARLADSWIWGAIGGRIGKGIARHRQRARVTPP